MMRFLVRHVGNMGDLVFFVPPILATLKNKYPDCHITFVTAWGLKDKKNRWGKRNQNGFCVSLSMTNPHIDQLIHFHSTKTVLDGSLCIEEGVSFPTWSSAYYEAQKKSDNYDDVFELDVGIAQDENPMTHLYSDIGMPEETYTDYKIYLTDKDKEVAASVMENFPRPRIVMLESIEGRTTRGWDPDKIPVLEKEILKTYGCSPIWFGAKFPHEYEGRPLTLRENIATLLFCDAGIGVLSGPIHFAAAVGLPTITLFCDQPLYRVAPAVFLNAYITEEKKMHRTLIGPTGPVLGFLKEGSTKINLTPKEWATQNYHDWSLPGRQATKSCVSVITVPEVMTVLNDIVHT
ncbi:MAG TPA: glycosyltransferase family 9 protein [Candidatus Andersenbacteria bacterium]|nr:glycosyltransferase family 9 protein [Candidatus Andersenbacteria bacterium]